MNRTSYHFLKYSGLISAMYIFAFFLPATAQKPVSNTLQDLLHHGIEQYDQGHFALAAGSLSAYLKQAAPPVDNKAADVIDPNRQKARYFYVLSTIKGQMPGWEQAAAAFVQESADPVYRQRAAFSLAHHYFLQNKLKEAIHYYEIAGITNLSNEEIADAKFELAYSYFNNEQFTKALPLFAAIKELPDHKYYVPGNYYYGLLAYNNKDYKSALRSFKRIHDLESYKDVVPYYEAEINYFLGRPDEVLRISKEYLNREGELYYDKDMQLLTAQTLFEQKKYKEALPYFEYYYNHSEKIRKEELYELAYTYYRLEDWQNAIKKFQPLSNAKDSLGQTSMYLLGDCYLKEDNKKGARNAFGICANMDFNQAQKEAASFLYAKLSYELGDEAIASRKFYDFIKTYPKSTFLAEAKRLLTTLLTQKSNYREAFAIMSDMVHKDEQTWAIYQKVAVGRALQLMQNEKFIAADSVFNLSLQQPIDPRYEAIAYFWKGEIAYESNAFESAIQYSNTFIDKARNRSFAIRQISPSATLQNARSTIGYAQLKLKEYTAAQEAFAAARETNQYAGATSDAFMADATLREADALFMQKDYKKAAALYDEAIAQDIRNPDYARFQKSMIYGFQGDQQRKRQILKEIIQKDPPSDYKWKAQHELAASYLADNELAEAIPLLKTLTGTPDLSEELKSRALMSLAYAYQKQGSLEEAQKAYQQYILDYPSSPNRQDAEDALRNLFILKGEPEAYAQFLETHDLPAPDENAMEAAYYDAAMLEYEKENWEKAAAAFAKYLERFPRGAEASKAHFYRGTCFAELNQPEQALSAFKAVVSAGWSEYAEVAAKKAAAIAQEQNNHETAITMLTALRDMAMSPENLQVAYEGLMKVNYAEENYRVAGRYADTLLSLPELSKSLEATGKLYQAKSLQMTGSPEAALAAYKTLENTNMGAISAEARYRIAAILLEQNKLEEAEKQASFSARHGGGQEYWVVQSYILLGDILTAEKDYFNAKATLESVVNHTNIPELKQKAAEKLAKVKALEKAQSKLSD